MIVVFDTNVWKSQVYLQSSQAAAVRFFLRHSHARVGLPEVIRREVESHARRDVLSVIASLKQGHQRLLGIFGTLKELVLPTEADVEKMTAQIFQSVGVPLIEVPFSFSDAQASFRRIIEQIPPSDRDQQFKDGVIWANCIELLKSDDVFLITNDKAFYEDRSYSKGLALPLQKEISDASHQLTVLSELSMLLSQIREQIVLDDDALAALWLPSLGEENAKLLANSGFQLGERTSLSKKLFATEDSRFLFVQFTAEYACPSVDEGRDSALLRVGGDCRYDIETSRFDQFRPQTEELRFRLPDGTEEKKGSVFMSAHMVIGHKDVSHSVRFDLNDM